MLRFLHHAVNIKCQIKTMEPITLAHLYIFPNQIIAYQHTIMINNSTNRLQSWIFWSLTKNLADIKSYARKRITLLIPCFHLFETLCLHFPSMITLFSSLIWSGHTNYKKYNKLLHTTILKLLSSFLVIFDKSSYSKY
jgi:hypothetical protein